MITTVDTVLHPSEDMAFVFFRTAITQEPSESGSSCWLCEDWLSLALYTKGAGGWMMMKFDKWFAKQGVYDRTAKPELVEAGRIGKAVLVISSDGEPEHSSTTHHLFGVPGLREALSIATEVYEVERGGPDGPMGEPVNSEYRFIPSDKDWYDVEVEEAGAKPVRWVYSSATGKYVPATKAPAR